MKPKSIKAWAVMLGPKVSYFTDDKYWIYRTREAALFMAKEHGFKVTPVRITPISPKS